METTNLSIKDYPPIKNPKELAEWKPADIAKIEGVPRQFWDDPDANNIQDLFGKLLRPLMRGRPFQFALGGPFHHIHLLQITAVFIAQVFPDMINADK